MFLEFSELVSKISRAVDNIYMLSNASQNEIDRLGGFLTNLEDIVDSMSILCSNEVLSKIDRFENEFNELLITIIEVGGKINDAETKPFDDALEDVIDIFREEMGIEDLTSENKSVISSKRKKKNELHKTGNISH